MGIMKELNWDHIRRIKWADAKPPIDWDQSLKPISLEGLSLLAMDPKGNLYWDGERLATTLKLTPLQKIGAAIVSIVAIAGGLGGAVQGWVALNDFGCKAGWEYVICPR
jgi:hypothetical protein